MVEYRGCSGERDVQIQYYLYETDNVGLGWLEGHPRDFSELPAVLSCAVLGIDAFGEG